MKIITFKTSSITAKKIVAYILDHAIDDLSVVEIPDGSPSAAVPIRADKAGHPYRLSLNSKSLRSIFEVGTESKENPELNGYFSGSDVKRHAVAKYGLNPNSTSPSLSVAGRNGLIEHSAKGYRLTEAGTALYSKMQKQAAAG